MKKIFQILLIFLLSSCSDELENVKVEDISKEYYEYETTFTKRFNFIEQSVNNANKYPVYYDTENNLRHDFYGEEFEDLPYFAEGYVIDINNFYAVKIPSNILIIRNYLDNEEVMYALNFGEYSLPEQLNPNTFIQVYGTLSEYSYQDNMLEVSVSGEIPEINVKILKAEKVVVLDDNDFFLDKKKIELGNEFELINELLVDRKIIESLDLFSHLNLEVQKANFKVFESHMKSINEYFDETLLKYGNPFSEYYDIETVKMVIEKYKIFDDIYLIDSHLFTDNIESIRELIMLNSNVFNTDIADYFSDKLSLLSNDFFKLKADILTYVDEACYFNIKLCDSMKTYSSNEFFNIFIFYEIEDINDSFDRYTKLSNVWQTKLFFSTPWKPYNGTLNILNRKYDITLVDGNYYFVKPDRKDYIWKARIKN